MLGSFNNILLQFLHEMMVVMEIHCHMWIMLVEQRHMVGESLGDLRLDRRSGVHNLFEFTVDLPYRFPYDNVQEFFLTLDVVIQTPFEHAHRRSDILQSRG